MELIQISFYNKSIRCTSRKINNERFYKMRNNDGLIRIREALNIIKPAERNAANYILEQPEEAVRLSAVNQRTL